MHKSSISAIIKLKVKTGVSYLQKKEEMRKIILQKRSNLPSAKVEQWSKKIRQKFWQLFEDKSFRKIMAYASIRKEVETFTLLDEILENGYLLYLPYTKTELKELGIAKINNLELDLRIGNFSIQEPIPACRLDEIPDQLDLVIVPAAAFSRSGYRIGYGGGYYDKFLAQLSPETLKVGFCYHKFLLASVPVEEHDQAVDIIITEQEIVRLKNEV